MNLKTSKKGDKATIRNIANEGQLDHLQVCASQAAVKLVVGEFAETAVATGHPDNITAFRKLYAGEPVDPVEAFHAGEPAAVEAAQAEQKADNETAGLIDASDGVKILAVDTEVVRTDGGAGAKGNCGKVVEVDEAKGRVRVYWHTKASGEAMKDPKRTWIKRTSVCTLIQPKVVVPADLGKEPLDLEADEAAADAAMDKMAEAQEAELAELAAAQEAVDKDIEEVAAEQAEETPAEPQSNGKANRFTVFDHSATAVLRAMGKEGGGWNAKGVLAAMEEKGASGLSLTTVRIQLLAGKKGQRGEPAPLTKKEIAELTKLALKYS